MLRKRIIRSLCLVACAVMLVFPFVSVFGAALTSRSDILSREQISTLSNHEIRFTTPTGVDASTDTITLTLPTDFTFGSVAFGDIDLFHGAVTGLETSETLAASSAAGTWGATVGGQVLTLTAPTDAAVGEITAGQKVVIRIGTGAVGGVNQITNPSAATNFTLSIAGTFGDAGGITIPIIASDSVQVSATVPTPTPPPGGGPSGGTDGTPPTISGVQAINITMTDADIVWQTDENADSRTNYGPDTSYAAAPISSSSLVSSHLAHLSGLSSDTLYHYRVTSKDAAGNTANSVDYSFRTAAPPSAPVISNVRVALITDSSAVVLWDTNIDATSFVSFGLSSGYGLSANTPGTVTNHAVSLTGLASGSTYHYRVQSEASGLSSVSVDAIFLTLPDVTPPTNVSLFRANGGNGLVNLSWINPTDPDFSHVIIVARTDHAPTSPTDGRRVYSGSGTGVTDTGLINGTHYFYAIYAYDAAGNASSGALSDATPTAPPTPPVPPPPPLPPPPEPPIPPTPPSPGPGGGGTVTTTPPVPPPIVPIPVPIPPPVYTTTTEPIVIPPPEPVPTPAGVILAIHPTFFVSNGLIEVLPDASQHLQVSANRPLLVRVPTVGLGSIARSGTVTVGSATYALTLSPTGNSWEASIVPSPRAAELPSIVALTFSNDAVATANNVISVRPLGRVMEAPLIGSPSLVLPNATVLVDQKVNGAYVRWDGRSYAEVNPVRTAADGTYQFFVANGTYRLKVSNEGYRNEVREFVVNNSLLSEDIALKKIPKSLATVIDPNASLGANTAAVVQEIGQVVQSIQTPQNQAIAENVVVPTAVVVAVASASTALNLFSLLTYLQFLMTQPILLLGKRKRRKWGVVYNALTKMPVDLAIVRLLHFKTNMVVQTRITDAKGRFTFLVQKGMYRLQVVKPGFVYPSVLMKNEKMDVDFVDLYHNEPIEVTEEAEVAVNIPLDPIAKEEIPSKIMLKKSLRKLQVVLGYGSLILSIVAVIVAPSLFTGFALIFQTVMFLLVHRLALPSKPKGWGVVYDEANKSKLDRTIVRIFDKKYNKLLETQITDRQGKYGFVVGKNVYYLTAERLGYARFQSPDLDLTRGKEEVVAQKIGLKKG